MISEKEFAAGFSGFWSENTPFMTPRYIAELNFDPNILADQNGRAVQPLASNSDSAANDVVAGIAFEIFAKAAFDRKHVFLVARNRTWLQGIEEKVKSEVTALRTYQRSTGARELSARLDESIELATRLQWFFASTSKNEPLTIHPRFMGCGILNSCYGDVHVGKTIFEVKTVDRGLRSTDLRQALIYCALNYFSTQYSIENISIVNPRRGFQITFRLETLTERICNKTPAELFHQMTDFLSNVDKIHHAP